jgi:hypothetical protein
MREANYPTASREEFTQSGYAFPPERRSGGRACPADDGQAGLSG